MSIHMHAQMPGKIKKESITVVALCCTWIVYVVLVSSWMPRHFVPFFVLAFWKFCSGAMVYYCMVCYGWSMVVYGGHSRPSVLHCEVPASSSAEKIWDMNRTFPSETDGMWLASSWWEVWKILKCNEVDDSGWDTIQHAIHWPGLLFSFLGMARKQMVPSSVATKVTQKLYVLWWSTNVLYIYAYLPIFPYNGLCHNPLYRNMGKYA